MGTERTRLLQADVIMKRSWTIAGAALLGTAVIAAGNARVAHPESPLMLRDSIASPAGAGAAQPNLTVDASGRVYMSWLEPADSGHALRFAVYDGAAWSLARTIVARRDFFVNWADFPSMLVLDRGRLAAHWLQRNGTGTYAYGVRVAQSSDSGRTWSASVIPHRDTTQAEHGFVAMWRESGKFGVVWLDGRKFSKSGHDATNEMMLVTTTLLPNGSLGPETRLDERTCDCCQNAAAMTSAGPIIVYRDRSPQEIRDIYVTRRIGNTWTAGVPVHDDNWKINACPVNGPAVAANANRVAIAWFTAANDSARVKLAFSSDAGATFAAPMRVDGGLPAGRVDVAFLPDGAALVTWIERIGGETAAVRARRVTADGRMGEPITIAASSAARASGFPRTAITKDYALFAWTQPGRPSTVRVARVALTNLR
jgi:hypothetical protein